MIKMRLIDADVLKRDICQYCNDVYSDDPCEPSDCEHMRIIDSQPTIDAVEVVHGHWFSLTDCSNAGVYCSACHKKVWREDYAWCNRKNKLRSNYCPNCGAKMDLEE